MAVYLEGLDEAGQVAFKAKAKVFCRTYSFLSSVIPYSNAGWEKLSILLNLLVPKLPAPTEDDLAKGILQAIDMDSYRVEKQAVLKIALEDKDAEIEPVPTDASGHKSEPELDRLSNILKAFNENFGTLFADSDRVAQRIRDDIAPQVAADAAYQDAKANTPHTARLAHDQALGRVMQVLLKDDTQVYKQFVQNDSFKRFVGDMVYAIASQRWLPPSCLSRVIVGQPRPSEARSWPAEPLGRRRMSVFSRSGRDVSEGVASAWCRPRSQTCCKWASFVGPTRLHNLCAHLSAVTPPEPPIRPTRWPT